MGRVNQAVIRNIHLLHFPKKLLKMNGSQGIAVEVIVGSGLNQEISFNRNVLVIIKVIAGENGADTQAGAGCDVLHQISFNAMVFTAVEGNAGSSPGQLHRVV